MKLLPLCGNYENVIFKVLIWKKKPCCIYFSSVIGFPAGLDMRTSHRLWTCLCFYSCFLKRIIFPVLFLYQPTSWLVCKRNKNCNTSLTSVLFWAQTSLQWQVSIHCRSSWGTEGVPDLPLAPDPPALQGEWKIPIQYCVFLFPSLKKPSSVNAHIYTGLPGAFREDALHQAFRSSELLCCLSPDLWDKL